MTAVFDRLRVGNAPPPANPAAAIPPQSGAPTSPMFVYACAPAPAANNQIALNQIVNNGTFTLTAGSGASLVTIQGSQYIDLGCARTLQVNSPNASGAAVAIVVNGLEETVLSDGSLGAGQPMSESITSPAGVGVTNGRKAFRYISSPNGIRTSGNTVSGVSIGTRDVFGMPLAVLDGGEVFLAWNGVPITVSTGLTLADTTSPATTTTGDVRGTWGPPPSPATGTRRLYAYIYARNPDTAQGVYGVTQV